MVGFVFSVEKASLHMCSMPMNAKTFIVFSLKSVAHSTQINTHTHTEEQKHRRLVGHCSQADSHHKCVDTAYSHEEKTTTNKSHKLSAKKTRFAQQTNKQTNTMLACGEKKHEIIVANEYIKR